MRKNISIGDLTITAAIETNGGRYPSELSRQKLHIDFNIYYGDRQ